MNAAAPRPAAVADAIVAISSPPGRSLRGLVRISGDDAFAVLGARLAGGSIERARSIQFVRLSIEVAGNHCQCPATALVMPAPRSFTGSDTVELLLPGNPHLLAAVVDALTDSRAPAPAARRAAPGEFSARAFAAGRLPIADAERIALTIAAESRAQFAAAQSLRASPVQAAADAAAQHVTTLLALVEAGIDFSDQEDVVAIEATELAARIRDITAHIDGIVRRTTPEESLRALPLVVLHGPPNAGKSSLFNALLGRTRTVESAVPGSTRDAIIEPLSISSGEVLLCDLPGIEDPQNALAAHMQLARRSALDRAQLALHCAPIGSAPPSADTTALLVWTKSDTSPTLIPTSGIRTSAHTREGLDALRAAIADRLDSAASSDEPLLLERHRRAIASAQSHLRSAAELADASAARGSRSADPAELVALELRSALDELGIVAGHRTPDDVLGELFARFCIGK